MSLKILTLELNWTKPNQTKPWQHLIYMSYQVCSESAM